eukprot:5152840-Pleurochrysis_carterae.AAC.4
MPHMLLRSQVCTRYLAIAKLQGYVRASGLDSSNLGQVFSTSTIPFSSNVPATGHWNSVSTTYFESSPTPSFVHASACPVYDRGRQYVRPGPPFCMTGAAILYDRGRHHDPKVSGLQVQAPTGEWVPVRGAA